LDGQEPGPSRADLPVESLNRVGEDSTCGWRESVTAKPAWGSNIRGVRALPWVMAAVVLFAAGRSEAGRRPYVFTWDTETVPKGDVELEQWLWVRGRLAPINDADCAVCHTASGAAARDPVYWLWWAPVIGLSSRVELALPFQLRSTGSLTALDSFEADVRIRLRSRDEEHVFEPLLRVAYHQPVDSMQAPRFDFNLVGSFGKTEQLHVTLDLGGRVSLPFFGKNTAAPVAVVGTYGLGLAYPILTDELRASVELYGEWAITGLGPPTGFPRHFGGASVSWTFGRFWLTAGVLGGLRFLGPQSPELLGRLMWAVTL
jgi:hypothetical protein